MAEYQVTITRSDLPYPDVFIIHGKTMPEVKRFIKEVYRKRLTGDIRVEPIKSDAVRFAEIAMSRPLAIFAGNDPKDNTHSLAPGFKRWGGMTS